MYKKLLLPLLLLILLYGCATETQETNEDIETAPADAVEIGTSSYSCVTGESEERIMESDSGNVLVKAFSHKIYNPNNKYVVTLTTTVTGSCSSAEGTAEITHVTGTLSDEQPEGFTLSEHLSGDTGTIVVYLNGISVCHFQYRIYSDGSVELL